MLLSNTCDATNDDSILLAPALPYEAFQDDPRLAQIRTNIVYSLFFLPNVPALNGRIIDLSLIHSVARDFLVDNIQRGVVHRVSSLSQLGYYFLLSKLTVHLLRPETNEINRGP